MTELREADLVRTSETPTRLCEHYVAAGVAAWWTCSKCKRFAYWNGERFTDKVGFAYTKAPRD